MFQGAFYIKGNCITDAYRIIENWQPYGQIKEKRENKRMFDKKIQMYMTDNEQSILIAALIDMKNNLHAQGRYTDCIDEIPLKIIEPKKRKVKIVQLPKLLGEYIAILKREWLFLFQLTHSAIFWKIS